MLEWSDLIKIFFFKDVDQIFQTDWLLLIKLYYYFIGWERTEGGRGLLIDILGRFVARGGDVCSSIVLLETSRGEFYLTSLLKFIVEAVLLIMASVIKSNNIIMKLL